jgi:diguanylate cyclase (GGDEF)-like protein/PAS domain S-box-containing protein
MFHCKSVLIFQPSRSHGITDSGKTPASSMADFWSPRLLYRGRPVAGRSQAILRTLFESVNEGLFILDATPKGFVFKACNPAFSQWMGLDPQALNNVDPREALPIDIGGAFYDNGYQCLSQKVSVRFQATIQKRSLIVTLSPVLEDDAPIQQLVGACQDITDLKLAEAMLQRSQLRLQRQNQTLMQLAHNQALASGNLSEALHQITEAAAEIIEVERVGVWLYNTERTRLVCIDLYDRSLQAHQESKPLNVQVYPVYFEALQKERAIAAADVLTDPRTYELGNSYLLGSEVRALLDAPVRLGGRVVGVICHEHTGGSRAWAEEELAFAGSVADLVTLALEASERQQAEQALRRAEERYRIFFEEAIEGIFFTTATGQCVSANPMLAKILGYESPAELSEHLTDVSHQLYVDPQRRQEFLRQIDENGAVWGFESAVYCKDGTTTWISENTRAVRDSNGILIGYEGTVENITARRRDQAIIEYMAYFDSLTGLANRERFDQDLEEALLQAQGQDLMVAVLFIDLDRFKQINDTLGHQVGDDLLKLAAERLKLCVRDNDQVARWGGDEFTILLPRIPHDTEVIKVAHRIQASFVQPMAVGSHSLHITCSIGVALYPRDGLDAAALLQAADTALYKVKESGRNGYSLFRPEMNTEALARLRIETDLREAIQADQFQLYYQPQVDCRSGELLTMEALLRWHHPSLGLCSPLAFIPVAEDSGLIVPIGRWVLQTACQHCRFWQQQGFPDLKVAVNLSVRQFREANLVEMIKEVLQLTALDPAALKLEITESVAMNHVEMVLNVLHQLRALGIQIAIDDFGVGYSSLNYLKQFPIDALKIDMSFVSGIPDSKNDVAVVRAIINLGRSLEMRVIAEGVETAEQAQVLRDLDCDEMQGYWFSRPLPSDQVLDYLLNPTHPTVAI